MSSSQSAPLHIRKVAVCGAGVMGAQIAAHCINAGVPVVLFDLASDSDPGGANALVTRAIAQLEKIRPAPLGLPGLGRLVVPANYDTDLHMLAGCDLVIEAIAERLDWKRELYRKIAPHMAAHAMLASNTSGLSIAALSDALPAGLRERFCGIHFFNPPRYMTLVELIPAAGTSAGLLDQLESFLVTRLGKGVVRARDTPNFIGNRIGVFGMLSVFHHTQTLGLPYELVDDLTGTRLGRAKSGTFRTADVVGLDVLAHVIDTMQGQLPNDPFHRHFGTPAVLLSLLEKGALGQKSGAGFYRRQGRDILRLNPAKGEYVPVAEKAADEVAAMLKNPDPAARLQAIHASSHPQARFLWAVLRDMFHYSAVHLGDIAHTARDVDLAMRWGFGHAQGPFELWQAAGWQRVAGWLADDIAAGRALSDAPLPGWVTSGPVWEGQAVHTPQGSYSPASDGFVPRSRLAVYQRQPLAPRLVGELAAGAVAPPLSAGGRVVYEDDSVLCWVLPGPCPDGVLILSFKTRMHTLGPGVIQGLEHALDLAEQGFQALVIGQFDDPFSAGADLKSMLPAYESGGVAAVSAMQKAMQDAFQRVRHARVPVVAALAGMVLGGGCELALHCARRVAAFETYMGLVEAGIGLLPGAGGMAWAARRAADLQAGAAPDAPLLAFLKKFVHSAATARVSGSALEARALDYLQDSDPVVMQRHELLYVAVHEAAQLARQGWHAPLAAQYPVAGRDAIATLRAQLVNMQVGGYISEHDMLVATQIAHVACGGDVDPGSQVDDAWMLGLERKAFAFLLGQPKTMERIGSLLQSGKPVRN